MSETVKNKHVKKKNSAVLLLKTVITAVLLFLYLVFMQSLYGISEKCNKSGK